MLSLKTGRKDVGAWDLNEGAPTSDDFVELFCDTCSMALTQEPGDGRLRRAGLTVAGEPLGSPAAPSRLTPEAEDRLREQFMAIGREILGG